MRAVVALAAVLCLAGCLQSTLGVLVAPQAVAGAAAANLAGSGVTAAGAGDAVRDLDRIIAAHPDAANAGELRQLRDELAATHQQSAPARTRRAEHADFDRRAPPPALPADRPRLEQAQVPYWKQARETPIRPQPRPFASPPNAVLEPVQHRTYTMPITPLRLPRTERTEPGPRG